MLGIIETIVNDKTLNLFYIDYKIDKTNNNDGRSMSRDFNDDESGEVEIMTSTKNINLKQIDNDFNEEKNVAEYLVENIKSVDTEKFNIDINKLLAILEPGPNTESLERKIYAKLTMCAYVIASEGRIGSPNSIVLNDNTYLNNDYGINLKNAIQNYANDNDLEIYYSKYIPENEIYLMKNSSTCDHPGYYIFKYTDNDNNKYYSIVGLGWFPEKQCAKINVIWNN